MSVEWTKINPVLIDLFSRMVREPDAHEWSAEWKEAPRQFINPIQQGALTLKVTSCVGVGEDEIRREMREILVEGVVVTDLVEVVCGIRRFVLRVEAQATEHTDAVWAMQTLERIRTRLSRPSVLGELNAVDVAVVGVGTSTKASATIDKRVSSIGFLDVTMTTVVNEADDVPVGWIERVIVTSHVKNPGGEELPAPPNWVNETIP